MRSNEQGPKGNESPARRCRLFQGKNNEDDGRKAEQEVGNETDPFDTDHQSTGQERAEREREQSIWSKETQETRPIRKLSPMRQD